MWLDYALTVLVCWALLGLAFLSIRYLWVDEC